MFETRAGTEESGWQTRGFVAEQIQAGNLLATRTGAQAAGALLDMAEIGDMAEMAD
jgi:hypothetical protein